MVDTGTIGRASSGGGGGGGGGGMGDMMSEMQKKLAARRARQQESTGQVRRRQCALRKCSTRDGRSGGERSGETWGRAG